MKILAAVAALVMAFTLASPAPVSAHPVTAACGTYIQVRIVVFQHSDFTGAWDDFCSSTQIGSYSLEPNFATNTPGGSTDIGDMNNMDQKVSAVSIQNIGDKQYCVTFFYDPNFGGPSFTERVIAYEHDHIHPNIFDNDQWSSLRIRRWEDGICINNH